MKKIAFMTLLALGSFAYGENVTEARANLVSAKDQKVSGYVKFTQAKEGVEAFAEIKGLKPGKHGLHIHEHGDCSAPDFSTAGAHYNPTDKKHGGPDSEERLVGDLGNIIAQQDGTAFYERIDSTISLNGPNSIVGRSIVIHSAPDDLISQPAGNSGNKIGCGVIEAVK